MIRRNLFYKLLALGVAMVLWVYVNSERNPQLRRSLAVGVKVRNLARGYAADVKNGEVTVSISGPKSAVESVRKEDVAAWVDLGGSGARTFASKTFRVNVRIAGVSGNDLYVSVSPRTVNVGVEALGEKRLPVEVKFVSAPPLGYSYSAPRLFPASVRVSGKSTQVASVKRVILTVPEEPAARPVDDYFPVTPIDAAGERVERVQLDSDKVHLKLELVEVPATKAVLVSPTVIGEPRYPARVTRVSVTPSSVTLEGKPSALVGVSTVSTDRILIDDASTTLTRDVAVRLPPGVDVVGRQTVRVTVFIAVPQ